MFRTALPRPVGSVSRWLTMALACWGLPASLPACQPMDWHQDMLRIVLVAEHGASPGVAQDGLLLGPARRVVSPARLTPCPHNAVLVGDVVCARLCLVVLSRIRGSPAGLTLTLAAGADPSKHSLCDYCTGSSVRYVQRDGWGGEIWRGAQRRPDWSI